METKILSVQSQNSLSVVQFVSSNIDTFDYISLDNALTNNLIEIKELGEGAQVNDVIVINNSDKFVFMMDGDIIQGAKQNRVINTSILLAPKTKTQVHVSCVEQGRWHHVSDSFTPSDYVAPSRMRQSKNEDVFMNLKSNRKAYANQGKVWDKVAESHAAFNMVSETANLSDIVNENKEKFKIFTEKFKCDENVNGIALFHGNKFVGLDLFNSSKIFIEYFPKILNGAAVQFFYAKASEHKVDDSELKYKVLETMDKIESFEKKIFKGVGVGTEQRFEAEKLNGFELIFDYKLIHLTAMNKN